MSNKRTGWRRFIGPKRAVVAVSLLGLLVGARLMGADMESHLHQLTAYAATHWAAAILLFVGIYTVAGVALVPTLPLNLVAGIIWGPWWGGFIAAAGATLGAAVAFVAARTLFGRVLARRYDNATVAALQQEFARQGWRFVGFVRVNPAFPTAALNYLFGLTSIRFRVYFLATAIFILPPSIAVAWIGYASGSAILNGGSSDWWNATLIIGACLALLMMMRYYSKLAKAKYTG